MPRSSFPVRRASRSQKKVKTHKVDNDGSGVVKDGIPRSVIVRQGTVSALTHTPPPCVAPVAHPSPTNPAVSGGAPREGASARSAHRHAAVHRRQTQGATVSVDETRERPLCLLCTHQQHPPSPRPNPLCYRWNSVKDYVHVAAQYGITHVWTVMQTDAHVHLRLIRLPHGPTLTFRIHEYTNARMVRAAQRAPVDPSDALEHSPLVVMHGFNTLPPDDRPASLAGISRPDAMKLVSSMWQHMFPQIQPGKVRLADCQRVVLVHMVPETGNLEFRHYFIRAVPVGLSRSAATLLKGRVPDLGGYTDISEFMASRGRASSAAGGAGAASAAASDSEGEGDVAAATVTLAQDVKGAGNKAAGRSAVKLTEIGPRMTLQLVKVEKGLGGGEVLYHAFQQRTVEEAEALARAVAEREAGRLSRKAQQAANVARKAEAKAAKKAAKAERKAARQEAAKRAAATGTLAEGDGSDADSEGSDTDSDAISAGESDDDDDDADADGGGSVHDDDDSADSESSGDDDAEGDMEAAGAVAVSTAPADAGVGSKRSRAKSAGRAAAAPPVARRGGGPASAGAQAGKRSRMADDADAAGAAHRGAGGGAATSRRGRR